MKKDRVKYLNNDYDLNEQVIQLLASDTFLYEYFKNIHKLTQNQNNNVSDQELANWITEEILKILDSNNITTNKIHNTLKSEYVLELIELTNSKTINRNSAREILASLIKTNKPPKDLINDLGLAKISDFGELNELCLQAIKNNPEAVKDYNSGKETAVKFLIGQVMRLSKGKADPNETELNILNILKNE